MDFEDSCRHSCFTGCLCQYRFGMQVVYIRLPQNATLLFLCIGLKNLKSCVKILSPKHEWFLKMPSKNQANKRSFDLDAAKKWANSGDGEQVIASKQTQLRHDSEWVGAKKLDLSDLEAVREEIDASKARVSEYMGCKSE